MTRPLLDVVVPVLWRPHRIRPLAAAIAASTVVPYRLTYLVDADDLPTREELLAAGLRSIVGPPAPAWGRPTYPSKVNAAYRELDAPFLAVFGDDVEPAPGWDTEALAVFDRDPDAGVVATNDRHNLRTIVGIHATHPVIRRAYVESYGGATADGVDPVFSEAYRHNYSDGELVFVARSRGAFRAATRSIVAHRHVQNGAPDDATYQEARAKLKVDRETQKRRLAAFDPRARGDARARGRRILLTNRKLARTGGSESALVAMKAELERRGAEVTVWTPVVGDLGRRIGAVDRLRGRWDLALANHYETIAGALRHAERVVQTCHGVVPKSEQPHPNADAHVAVSGEVYAHAERLGFRPIATIPNGVDLFRYRPDRRPDAYPDAPERVALVSNYVAGGPIARRATEIAASRLGRRILFEHVRHVADTAPLMRRADVVLGLGRTALEGLASGAHVVVWDARTYQDAVGDGPLLPELEPERYETALSCNLSGRGLRIAPDADELADWILAYRPTASEANRAEAVRRHDVVGIVSRYLGV